MIKLTHLEKQAINESLIEKMRYILAGKEASLIGEKGMQYTSGDTDKVCLIGGIGPTPDNTSPYIQAPNSLGTLYVNQPVAFS